MYMYIWNDSDKGKQKYKLVTVPDFPKFSHGLR